MPADDDLPDSVLRALAEGAGAPNDFHAERVRATRRIYVNRDLPFEAVSVIGFDMDYTLACYRQDALERLSIEVVVDKLLARGYPQEIREIRELPGFAIRGLVVDAKLGNLLKLDRHGYVGRAFHGTTRLPRDERKSIYRAQRIGTTERERFAYVDTLFSLPEVTLYAGIVDLLDARPSLFRNETVPSYAQVWSDVREAMDASHQDDSIKTRISAAPHEYLVVDPELPVTLHKLRSSGKKLFLLTNSHLPYVKTVMGFILDGKLDAYDSWTKYFEWIVVGASKPAFFSDRADFVELDVASGRTLGAPRAEPTRGRVFEGGSQSGLQAAFGVFPDEVLYVGDHIYGDIVKSRKLTGWRTALVVEELEHDVEVRASWGEQLREIEALVAIRGRLSEKLSAQRQLQRVLSRVDTASLTGQGMTEAEAEDTLEEARGRARHKFERLRAHKGEIDEVLERRRLTTGRAFNTYWGSVFSERYDTSMFGAQVENYACLYTSRVSNFSLVSPAHAFLAPHGAMPHWMG